MAVRTVQRTALNAAEGQLVDQLAGIVNDLSTAMNALTAKLDADAGVTDADYASTIGTLDTVAYSDGVTPT